MMMPAMSVLHIITGLSNGGAEAVLYRLCISDSAHKHTVISLMDAGKYGPLLEAAGVRVHYLDMPRGRVTLKGIKALWRMLRTERPDVVQTWMYHADLIGGLFARLAGVRKVFWGIRHTDLVPGQSSKSTILIARLCARLSRFIPSGIVCCAERARVVHVELGYAADKCVVIPNGYDVKRFRPDPQARLQLRKQWGVDESIPLLGMVARFNPQKDHYTLLAALATLKQQGLVFRCALIGHGMNSDNEALCAVINQHELRDTLILLDQRSDIPDVMAALDLHVLPSSFGEAFPNVLAEAMACGTPCVSTDVGDAALIVGDTGWVVPPRDPGALAGAIESALHERNAQPQDWVARQQAAREWILASFSLEKMVAAYSQAWAGKA